MRSNFARFAPLPSCPSYIMPFVLDPLSVTSKNSAQGSFLPQHRPRGACFRGIKDRFSFNGFPDPHASRFGTTGSNPKWYKALRGKPTLWELACSSLKLPHDNSSSTFRPAAGGTGWLQCYQRLTYPLRSAGCPALGGCALDGSVQQIRGGPSVINLLRTGSGAPVRIPRWF